MQLIDNTGKEIIPNPLLDDHSSGNWQLAAKGISQYKTIYLNGRNYRCLWSTAETKEDTSYALMVASSMEEIHSDLQGLLFIFFAVIPLALIITGLTAYFISRAAFRSVTRMAETAQEITASSLNKRLQLPKAHDEVRMLGETLNDMIKRIDSAFKAQQQFIADASHEIRTPLTIIQSELELAERNSTDTLITENIKIALSEVDSMSSLTNSLLTLSKLDSMQMRLDRQPVRLDELLADCIQSMSATAAKENIQLFFHISEAIEILADREKLKSIFVNLIDNAIKYSHTNSAISIKMEKANDDLAAILIKDHGIGIAAEELANIFKRFYRCREVRARVRGNGLGLAIAQEFVAMHKGKILITSEPGKGTLITVQLPIP